MREKAKPEENKNVGMRTIAEKLGVSIGTVDRALHNRGRIHPETRARVLKMAKQLGYTPNLAARHLRLNHQFNISVHLPYTIASFFDRLRSGIDEGAMPFRHAMTVSFNSYKRSAKQPQTGVQKMLADGVQGIILAPSNTNETIELIEKARRKGVATICVATDVPESSRLTAVTAHPHSCGAMSAEIIANSTQATGPVAVLAGNIENYNQSEKVRGFRQLLSQLSPEHSIGPVLECREFPDLAYQQTREIFQKRPNLRGLYITNANSIPAIHALQELGKLSEVTIVTTDLFPELVPFIREGAVKATIYQCPEQQGAIAIRALFQYLSEDIVPESSIEVIPQLVMRSNLSLYTKN